MVVVGLFELVRKAVIVKNIQNKKKNGPKSVERKKMSKRTESAPGENPEVNPADHAVNEVEGYNFNEDRTDEDVLL